MRFLKLSLLFFWTVWYLSITLTNAADWMYAKYRWPLMEKFGSGNLEEIRKAVATIHESPRAVSMLFCLVLVSEAVATILYLISFIRAYTSGDFCGSTLFAFAWSMILWQAFLVADSIFRTYQYTPVHFAILSATLLTALTIHAHVSCEA